MVSIIIPTRNRQRLLALLLDSLRLETYTDGVEVVIVDNGNDETDAYIAELSSVYPHALRYFLLEERATPGLLRNYGVKKSNGSILVFIDSDCMVTPGWLSALCTPFVDDSIGAVGGPDSAHPHDSEMALCVNYIMTSSLTTGGLRGSRRRLFRYHPRSFNMAVRRSVFEALGGFADRFYGEDILLSAQIEGLGKRLHFSENAVVRHSRKSHVVAFAKQLFFMGKARPEVACEEPTLMQWKHAIPLGHLLYVLIACVMPFLMPSGIVCLLIYGVGVCVFTFLIARDLSKDMRLKRSSVCVLFLFLVQQLSYGCGFAVGLISFFSRKGR